MSMKLSICRVVRSSTQPTGNPRILPHMCSRSNPTSRAMRWHHRESEQTHRVPGQIRRSRRAHRHPRRRNRPAVLMSSKLEKMAKQRHQTRWSRQKRSALRRPNQRQKIHRVGARTIYAPNQDRSRCRAHQHQRRRSRPTALMSSKPQRRLCQRRQSRRSSRDRSIPQ